MGEDAGAASGRLDTASPSVAFRYLTLDAWRGAACLLVVLGHSVTYVEQYPSPVAWHEHACNGLLRLMHQFGIGVTMFFVISGYCVTAAAHAAATRGQRFGWFMRRRVRRILPPYLCMVAVTATAVVVAWWAGAPQLFSDDRHPIPHPLALTWDQWLGNLTLTETWRYAIGGAPLRVFVGHAWSLCYEEQFYLVTGLCLLLCGRHVWVGLAAVTAAVLVVSLLKMPINGFFFDGHWFLFAAGAGVFYYRFTTSWMVRTGIVAVLAGCAAGTFAFRSPQWAYFTYFVVGTGYAGLLIALSHWDTAISRLPVVRYLGAIGLVSYSLYLVHWPVTKGVVHALAMTGVVQGWPGLGLAVPAAVVASAIAAVAFYHLVERRFLNSPVSRPVPRRTVAIAPISGAKASGPAIASPVVAGRLLVG